MRTMKRIAAALLSAAIALPVSALAQDDLSQQSVFTIGPWSGMRFADTGGATVSCAAMTSAGGKDALAINIAPTGGLIVSVSREGWKFPNDAVDAELVVDDVTVATSAQGLGNNVVRVLFTAPDDAAVYNRLRTGHVMRMQTRKGDQSYDLTGLDKAMPALAECVAGKPRAAAATQAAAPSPAARHQPGDPFDVPGATRVDKSQVMAVLANSMSEHNEPRHTFLLADELAAALPGYDVGWRTETGVLVGTAVRGRIGADGIDAVIGNLLALDAGRCTGKLRIEIDPPQSPDHTSKDIHAYCDGGGNGKEAHYLIWAYEKGGAMITRFEPVSMKDPKTLMDEIYKD
jgi:hypothetical protein